MQHLVLDFPTDIESTMRDSTVFLEMIAMLPFEVEGSEQVPVPFRYDISPLATKRTILYRPNTLQGEPKTASLGAVWAGKYDKVPSNKIVDVVWEVLQLLFPCIHVEVDWGCF